MVIWDEPTQIDFGADIDLGNMLPYNRQTP